jgi:hypothetical protein
VFEQLIEQAHGKGTTEDGWDEEKYQKCRMDERIRLLSAYLPQFLVQNHRLWGILSKGVHELSEAECLAAFPVVKVGIEMILDDELARLEREKKIAQATKDIGSTAQKIQASKT